ncbi:hypothetical protein [Rhodosalinus sediminis]|uniref:hypothetical protein n=1 Tax=Rhodosalinus sediminis TaxID=1940533 RepID=UPI00235345E5|nr:hypothetical protein [Rhodosalinus sediminis]
MRRDLRNDRVKLPRVNRVRAGGRLYRYHRVTGAKLPSDVPEDAPTFIAAWTAEEAKAGEPKRPQGTPGTISAAIEALIASEKWRSLSESDRGLIRRELDEIREAYGDAPFGRLEAKHITADIGNPPAIRGRKRRKAWRLLCTWSIAAGLIQTDPSAATATPPAPRPKGIAPGPTTTWRRFGTAGQSSTRGAWLSSACIGPKPGAPTWCA